MNYRKNRQPGRLFNLFLGFTACLFAASCTVTDIRASENLNLKAESRLPTKVSQTLKVPQTLDVGILTFDLNIPDSWREMEGKQIVPDVRKTESVVLPYMLKEVLAQSKQWGVVRVLPRSSNTFEVSVEGKILLSNGERLKLQILVSDASGKRWFKRVYERRTNTYSYEDAQTRRADPFYDLYEQIAHDMLVYRQKMKPKVLKTLHHIAKIRFAKDFSPEAFEGYVKTLRNKKIKLLGVPSEESPSYQRISKIRDREHLFVDVLNERYANFYENVYQSYLDWRKFSYSELLERRRLRRNSILSGIAGIATIAAGIIAADAPRASTRVLGDVGVLAGSMLIKDSLSAGQQAQMHSVALEELNASFSDSAAEQVLEVEDVSITLTGTIEEQYLQLRDVLKKMWSEDAPDGQEAR